MKKRIAVVGGSCVDIFAASAQPIIPHDSNPGTVHIGFGGVGRNIAENLARLGQEVFLLAAFGGDPFSRRMLDTTTSAGVNTKYSPVSSEAGTPYYISVNDSNGDMHVAVSDMDICGLISPAFLSQNLELLNRCDAIVLDTNIPRNTIEYIASACTPPLFADAVSTKKAVKLSSSLPHLHTLNTNLKEAEALLGTQVEPDLHSLRSAADRFHEMGIAYVLITLGENGAFLSAGGAQMIMDAYRADTVNANGCGDAFSAAAFLGIITENPPETILRNALAAAAITAQSAQAVSSCLSENKILTLIQKSRNTL